MSVNIGSFKDEWYIWWVDGQTPIFHRGDKLVIGTGEDGAAAPFFGPGGEVCVGATILRPDGAGGWQRILSSEGSDPLALTDGNLRWIGIDPEGHPVRIYISVAEAMSRDDQVFRSLYGSTLHGDPDQVAVWGANDTPP